MIDRRVVSRHVDVIPQTFKQFLLSGPGVCTVRGWGVMRQANGGLSEGPINTPDLKNEVRLAVREALTRGTFS